MKFNVGDRVRFTEDYQGLRSKGDIGTITEIDSDGDYWVTVEGETCRTCSGRDMNPELELVQPEQEVLSLLPVDPAERKNIPIGSGVLDYFPAALIEIAKVSKAGNDQHNPGEPLRWARGKSTDHSDTIIRHWIERGTIDSDGMRHSAKLAWRALANLQMELENAGAPKARGAR